MSQDLIILNWVLLATALMAFPYVLDRIAVRGLFGAMANPSSDEKPQNVWADRAKSAHANAIENLVVFAPAALLVHIAELGNGVTVTACIIYLSARIAHYIVYTLGIPVLRTLTFFAGWGATMVLLARVGGVI